MGEKHHSFFSGMFFGGLLGGFLAFLFTPFTGYEARKKIGKKIEEIKLSPGEAIDGIKENTEEVIASTISSIEEGISRISQAVNEAKKTADEKRKELGENL